MLDAIARREPGLLTYGITPPKRSWAPQRVAQVADRQAARMNELPVDGIVVYDLQDESARTDVERPFPYQACIDPVTYAYDHLRAVELPKVVYRCVAPLDAPVLRHSMQRISQESGACVLVGAASFDQPVAMRLSEAYELRAQEAPDLVTGGVLIGERHRRGQGEHERVLRKVDHGCSFFITQAVYSAEDTKDVLSDLWYRCEQISQPVPPVLVTLTPCGSERTLAFLRWLGVAVPRWLENELIHAQDTLAASVDLCLQVFEDLHRFATAKGIPLGCNVESVSLQREEIEASVELVDRVAKVIYRPRRP